MTPNAIKLLLLGNHTIYLHGKSREEAIQLRSRILGTIKESFEQNKLCLIEIDNLVFGSHSLVAIDITDDNLSLQERYIEAQERICKIMEEEKKSGDEWKGENDDNL